MWWVVGGIIVGAIVIIGGGLWFLGPTLGTFKGPDFEPTAKDDASVERARQSGTITGGGASAGM